MREHISEFIEEKSLEIHPGDIIVLYSDGITEVRNHPGRNSERFGIKRLMDSIEKASNKTAQ
jgi:two-component system, sensor histidine kinase ChiS